MLVGAMLRLSEIPVKTGDKVYSIVPGAFFTSVAIGQRNTYTKVEDTRQHLLAIKIIDHILGVKALKKPAARNSKQAVHVHGVSSKDNRPGLQDINAANSGIISCRG